MLSSQLVHDYFSGAFLAFYITEYEKSAAQRLTEEF